MRDRDKTKQQLTAELSEMRQQLTQLEEERRRLLEQLRETEEMSFAVANATPDFMAILDRDMVIRNINRPMAQRFGKRPGELVGTHGMDLLTPELADSRKQHFDEVLQTGQVCRWEDENRGVYFDNIAYPVREENGQVTRIAIIGRDITARRQVEEALKESEEKFRLLTEKSVMGTYVIQDSKIVYVNPSLAWTFGYEPEEIVGNMSPADLIHPDDIGIVMERLGERFEGEIEDRNNVYRAIKKDGSIIYIEVYTMLIDYQGRPAVMGTLVDITEHKQAEEALRASEEKYRQLMESLQEGIWVIDTNANTTYVNQPMADMLGYSPDEMLGKHLFDFMDDSGVKIAGHLLSRRQQGVKEQHDFEFVRKDGTRLYVLIDTSPLTNDAGDYIGAIAGVQDITERRQAEEEHELILKTALDGFWLSNLRGEFLEVNDSYCEMIGYPKEELLGMSITDIESIETPEMVAVRIDKIMKQGSDRFESKHRRKDGEIIDVDVSINYMGAEAGHFFVFIRDITERKRAAEALQQSEKNFRNSLDDSPLGIRIVTSEGKTLYANKAILDIYGYSSLEELEAIPAEQRYTPQSYAEYVERREKRKVAEYVPSSFEISIVRKNGEVRVLQVFRKMVRWAGQEQYQIIYHDITERKQMEEERRRIEKLESLGTLAGGIAHDFNNLLTGIMGNVSLVQSYVDPESKAAERLLEAEEAAMRARDLTQHLLTFARGGEPVKETIDIGRLVSDSANFILRGSQSRCIVDVPESLWQANVDKGQINEVISNLVINADEAMLEGGTINISVRNRIFGEENPLSLPKGDYIEISIGDHGVGISEDNLPRIFEPYFTTKEKGSGLGLATTYSIIQHHKGLITVDSIPETGTTFRVYLPATRRSSTSLEEEPEDVQASHTGKILIMDDEEAIRRMLRRALSEVGHTVVASVDGADAIQQYTRAREQEQPFDVVILDLTVPGAIGGVEAMKQLLEIDPDVKAIVSSGYSTDPIMADYKKYGFSAVIVKPYRVRELREMICNVLQEKQG